MARSKDSQGVQPKKPALRRCTTLLADAKTVCNKLVTTTKPRCLKHQREYAILTRAYKKHAKIADSLYTTVVLVTFSAVRLLQSSEEAQQKLRVIDKFIQTISLEISGRNTHHQRFFEETDSGHVARIKGQEAKLTRAKTIRNVLDAKRENLRRAEVASVHRDLVSIPQNLAYLQQNSQCEQGKSHFFPTEENNVTVEHESYNEDAYHSGTPYPEMVVNIPKPADPQMTSESVSASTHQCSDSKHSSLPLLLSQPPTPVIDRPVIVQTHPTMRSSQETLCQYLQIKDIDKTRGITTSSCGRVSGKLLPPIPTTLVPIHDAHPSKMADQSHKKGYTAKTLCTPFLFAVLALMAILVCNFVVRLVSNPRSCRIGLR
ncbi:hypothetical protein QCA50_015214 [Cerrena zonata]|uniref:Uncharacterized protein n=1 Tax=Cerrena zonata TaxID=2478898 RepID=A0AAW0FM45_9APHY